MFICKYCGKTFKTVQGCISHEKYYCESNPNRQQKKKGKPYTNHKKVACSICGKLFDVANIKRHEASCGKQKLPKYQVSHEGLNCIFCSKLCKNKNSLAQHELRCKENPNRVNFDSFAKYILVETAFSKQQRYQKSVNTLRERIASGDIRYDNKVHCKYKFGTYKGIHCDSSWELAFVIYNIDHKIDFIRNTECFLYIHNGVTHYYYPDFIINNVYYEIKGYIDGRVVSKCANFPTDKTLVVLDEEKMQPYLAYCIATYGKDFATMYDRSSLSWMDLLIN